MASALVLAAVLAITAPAGATTYCVGYADPGCQIEGTAQSALTDASNDSQPSSLVELGPGSWAENNLQYPAPTHVGHTTEVIGVADSADPTVLTHSAGDPHPVIDCQGGALTLHRLVVRASNGSTTEGVTGEAQCALTLDSLTVDMTAGTGVGASASGSVTIKNSTVTAGGTSAAVSLSTAQASTVIDSKLTGIPALLDLGPGAVTAQRLTLTSNTTAGAGVLVQATANNTTLALDDSLIKTATGATALRSTSGGVVAHTAAITARQITAVADATAASPLWAHSDLGPATISVYDSIASGYVQGVKLEGGASPANIDLHDTALPSPNTPATLNGATTYVHTDAVFDIAAHPALFVNPGANDFHLSTSSTLVDADATALAPGESATDLLGHTRIVSGKRDLGAIEHQAPTVAANVPASGRLGQSVAFAAVGASDGGSVSYAWTFGDGTGGATAAPSHTYLLPGTYSWSVTVGDGKGASASASGAIVISAALPTVTWLAPDQIAATSIVLHGAVNPMGGTSSYRFDYGPTATYGTQTTQVVVGSGVSPIDASTIVTGLQPAHSYHARIVAIQGQTTVYGADQTFSTAAAPVGQSSDQPPPATTKSPLQKKTAKIVCKVPRLTGKTLTQARKALTKAHCRLGSVHRRHMRSHHGRIVLQQRRAGKTYARNTKVSVTLAK